MQVFGGHEETGGHSRHSIVLVQHEAHAVGGRHHENPGQDRCRPPGDGLAHFRSDSSRHVDTDGDDPFAKRRVHGIWVRFALPELFGRIHVIDLIEIHLRGCIEIDGAKNQG